MHVHTSAYVYTFTPKDTQVYTDVHIFKEINSNKPHSLKHPGVMRSYYPSETRGSMRKPPRIRAINLSLSLLIFLFFHWTNAVAAGHTTVRRYLELQSCFPKALGVIWRSFLYSLTLRKKQVSEARNSNSFSIFLEKPPSGLWSLHFSLYPVTSVVMTVMAPWPALFWPCDTHCPWGETLFPSCEVKQGCPSTVWLEVHLVLEKIVALHHPFHCQ